MVYRKNNTPRTLTARSPRYLTTATAWRSRETLQRLLLDHHPFGLLPRENVLPPRQGLELAASQSIEASGQGTGLRQIPWAATSSTVGPKLSASRKDGLRHLYCCSKKLLYCLYCTAVTCGAYCTAV